MIGNGAVALAEGAPSLAPLTAATGVFSYLWVLIALPLFGAAAEVVVGLAIIVTVYRSRRSASIDEPNLLKY